VATVSEPGVPVEADDSTFYERVLMASHERAVVADFWATWCGPCRALSPVLERVVASLGGRAALVKVDVDRSPALSAEYGIRAVPAVKVFVKGSVAAEFVGVLGEPDVRRLIERALPSPAEDAAAEAARLVEAGDFDRAEALCREALAKDSAHEGARLGLAAVAVSRGDFAGARKLAESVEPGSPAHATAQGLLARLEFAERCRGRSEADVKALESRLAEDAGDLDAAFDLASCLVGRGRHRRALELLMGIVERERSFRDGAAKDAMVKLFALLGPESDLADEFRRRLARALY
jgi:putative thioredoxin